MSESKEAIALALLEIIARHERKTFGEKNPAAADLEWTLSTYAKCLRAVNGKAVDGDEEGLPMAFG